MGQIRDAARMPLEVAPSQRGTYCHAWREGFGCCTLLAGHGGTRHVDTFHNRSWPMS